MPYYKLSGTNRITYFAEATTPQVALTNAETLVSGSDIILTVATANNYDFSLRSNAYPSEFSVISAKGNIYLGNAASEIDMINRWQAAFPAEVFTSCKLSKNKNYDLLAPLAPVAQDPFGVNVHYGQATNEYTVASIPSSIAKMQALGFNYSRDNYTASSDAMLPSAGNFFDQWLNASETAGLGVMPTLSMTAASAAPTVANANFTATLSDSSSYTKSEYDAMFLKGKTRGINFATRYKGRIKWICLGSELENLAIVPGTTNTKALRIKLGSGTGNPPLPVYNATSDTWVWTSNANLEMKYFGMFLALLAGLITGLKQVDSTLLLGMNYSFIHYGFFIGFCRDLQTIYGLKLDWMGADWYNTEDFGTDISHNIDPVDVPATGLAIDRLSRKFLDSKLVTYVGMTETGFNTARSTNGLTQTQFLKNNIYDVYWKDRRCKFVFFYELLDETVTRASSTDPAERTYGMNTETTALFGSLTKFPRTYNN